jgi:tripartite-type tricarboxylate transporter receptor subunit TctC
MVHLEFLFPGIVCASPPGTKREVKVLRRNLGKSAVGKTFVLRSGKAVFTLSILPAIVLGGWHEPAPAQQPYPSRPVRIISPFPAGGGNDLICRVIAPRLSENLKQQVIVENRGGANGILGTEAAARSAPDGYTIVLIPSGHAVNATLYSKLPFDSIRDFTPLSLVGSSPLVLAMHPSVPTTSVKALIALARSRPGQLTYASAGVGSSGHLAGALFEAMTDTKLVHVPYKGMGLAVTDLIGGQVTLTFGTSGSVMPHVRSRRLRALATTGAQRSPSLADIPTISESGVPNYEASIWYGFVGPARMPPDIVQRLNAEIVAVLKLQAVRDRLATDGVDTQPSTPEELARLLASDVERWARVIQRVGVRLE